VADRRGRPRPPRPVLNRVRCPACAEGRAEGLPVECAWCGNRGLVTSFEAANWHLAQGGWKGPGSDGTGA
jgi:hypothetical protein